MGHHAIRLAGLRRRLSVTWHECRFWHWYARQFWLYPLRADGDIDIIVPSGHVPGTRILSIRRLAFGAELCGVRLVEVISRCSKNIGDDPQVLPIVLNGPMQAFKDAPQTDVLR